MLFFQVSKKYTHKHTHEHTHKRVHTHTHTHTHTRTHANTHTYTYTYTYARTLNCAHFALEWICFAGKRGGAAPVRSSLRSSHRSHMGQGAEGQQHRLKVSCLEYVATWDKAQRISNMGLRWVV